jgi:hypothetical protein
MVSTLCAFQRPPAALPSCSPVLEKTPACYIPLISTDFNLLASLQLAVRSPAATLNRTQFIELEGTNTPQLRAQGRLCITFAMRNQQGTVGDKRRVANELEELIDGAFLGVDYRRRIYVLGGLLAGDDGLLRKALKEEVTLEELAVGSMR